MAHRFAQELNCTPWEGLLRAVRIAAGKVSYIQWVLAQALDDRELEGRLERRDVVGEGDVGPARLLVDPDTGEPLGVGHGGFRDRSWWVLKEELWVTNLARFSKMAIDAGVAEALVKLQQDEVAAIAQVLTRTLGELGLDETQTARARGIMRRELLALESSGQAVIEGVGEWRE